MFSVLSGSLSSSISRFITFELGKGNIERLKTIFSTGVNIQLGMSVLIIIIAEAVGIAAVGDQHKIRAVLPLAGQHKRLMVGRIQPM